MQLLRTGSTRYCCRTTRIISCCRTRHPPWHLPAAFSWWLDACTHYFVAVVHAHGEHAVRGHMGCMPKRCSRASHSRGALTFKVPAGGAGAGARAVEAVYFFVWGNPTAGGPLSFPWAMLSSCAPPTLHACCDDGLPSYHTTRSCSGCSCWCSHISQKKWLAPQ